MRGAAWAGAAAVRFPVPGYLPAAVRRVLPWARQHVARVSRRYDVGIDDLWDETLSALVRVSVHRADNADDIRSCDHYCRTAVHRACWRYVVRQAVRRPRPLEVADEVSASAEDEVMAREAAYLRARDSSTIASPRPLARASAPSNLPTADRPAPPAAGRVRSSNAAAAT